MVILINNQIILEVFRYKATVNGDRQVATIQN